MTFTIDPATKSGAHALERLRSDQVVWLTTVNPQGEPVPSPVWFVWQDGSVLVYSEPNKSKVTNIASNPSVSLTFDVDENGQDVVIINGRAAIDTAAPPCNELPEYIDKYHEGILGYNMTDDSYAESFSVAIRIVPERLRAW